MHCVDDAELVYLVRILCTVRIYLPKKISFQPLSMYRLPRQGTERWAPAQRHINTLNREPSLKATVLQIGVVYRVTGLGVSSNLLIVWFHIVTFARQHWVQSTI